LSVASEKIPSDTTGDRSEDLPPSSATPSPSDSDSQVKYKCNCYSDLFCFFCIPFPLPCCSVADFTVKRVCESAVRKPYCACNMAYRTACLRISNGGKGQMLVDNVNMCTSYLVGNDNGIVSYVGDAAGRSRLQAGTLLIFLTRASQEQTHFVKLAASLRAGSNRKQRTKINLILYLFCAIRMFFLCLISTNCTYGNNYTFYYYYYYYYFVVYSLTCFGYI
jgi:hypothetical protein